MRYPRAPLWCGGEGGGEVLAKKGRRKVGEGERSSRVGLLLGLCRGLMACNMRPFPSFSMCFCGGQMEKVMRSHGRGIQDQFISSQKQTQHPHQSSLRTKHLQEVPDELSGFLLPFLDEVDALLLHLLHKLFALLLHISNFPLHLVHALLQMVLLLLEWRWDFCKRQSFPDWSPLPWTEQRCVSYVNEADVEFLRRVPPLQVPPDVNVVVTDDARDDVRGGDALRPLSRRKHTCWRFDVLLWFVTPNTFLQHIVTCTDRTHPLLWCACIRHHFQLRNMGYHHGPQSQSTTFNKMDSDTRVNRNAAVAYSCAKNPLTRCFVRNSGVSVQGASLTTSSTYRQCLMAS